MKIYSNQNVLEASLDRLRWLFDEFKGRVAVCFSGGKDSTVIFNLALQVAREKGMLPLAVVFLDQEAEWQATADLVQTVMTMPDVKPYWFQFPFNLDNAASDQQTALDCWAPEKEAIWMRPRWEGAIKENPFGVVKFVKLFPCLLDYVFPDDGPAIFVTGVRCEESPPRTLGLTHYPTYKGRTWGKKEDLARDRYSMHPIYDWSYSDVWKAIHEHGWAYNRVYDAQYAHGVPLLNMRVSNLHHETAVHALFYLQEVEPETYWRLCRRLPGIDMAGKMGDEDFWSRTLPPMFGSWTEYRDFLLERLWSDPERRRVIAEKFARMDKRYGPHMKPEKLGRVMVSTVLTNDYGGVKLYNFERGAGFLVNKKRRGHEVWKGYK